jgi:hypothetical protein
MMDTFWTVPGVVAWKLAWVTDRGRRVAMGR